MPITYFKDGKPYREPYPCTVLIAGLAYEYEFGGEAKTTVKGLSTPTLSIKGSSGMLELGYIIQNKDVNVPAVYIGLQGSHG